LPAAEIPIPPLQAAAEGKKNEGEHWISFEKMEICG
jgi:hypothetical protein